MAYIPLFIKTDDTKTILIIGGGVIAAAKAESLLSSGASIEVIAPDISDGLKTLQHRHGFTLREEIYNPVQLEQRKIVIAATNDKALNTRIAKDCRNRDILVNVVDDPDLCDFIFPALVRRGPLQIAISSSGISPVLARMVKHTIEKAIPASFENLVDFMARKKEIMRDTLSKIQPRRLFGEELFHGPIAEDVLEGNFKRADMLFDHLLREHQNKKQAALYLIGAGPGNPELITLKAIRLLSQADVILHDRLVCPELITQYARKDAQKISVSKARGNHHKTQAQIETLIEHHLRQDDIVVRLKGGDPGIYAQGAGEIAIAKRLGAPYQIVPGISAANGCAAYAGIPLTERDGAQSVRFITLYSTMLRDERFWEALKNASNDTLVFYMSTPHYALLCDQLQHSGFSPETPVLIVEQGTTSQHRQYSATLKSFEDKLGAHHFASPCLMIVGDVTRHALETAWKEAPQEAKNFFPTPQHKERACA